MADNSKYGSFVATTNIYDLEGKDIETVLIRLRQTLNELALSNNIKDSGYYVLEEFLNGQRWFPDPALNSTTAKAPAPRQVFRKVVNFGALPNATSKTAAHGLSVKDTWTFTRMYATASDPVSHEYISIPYADLTASGTGTIDLTGIKWSDTSVSSSVTIANDSISLEADGTNVTITTGTDRSAFTSCYVVLEYIKE